MNPEGGKGVMELYYNLILKKKSSTNSLKEQSKYTHVCNPNMELRVFTRSSRSNSSHRRLVLYKKQFPQLYSESMSNIHQLETKRKYMISLYGIALSFKKKKYNSATRTGLGGCPWYIARKVLTMYKASSQIVKINNVTMGTTACV